MSEYNKKTFKGELCQPLDPHDLYEVFCTRQFPGEDITITLRPLSIPTDDPVLRELTAYELPERREMAEVLFRTRRDELSILAASDFGQSFIGMVGDHPAFLVVIHRVQQNILDQYYASQPGDYRIAVERLPLVDGHPADVFASAVWRSCPLCFFAFPEVKRLISTLDIFRPLEKQYCRAAGFRPLARTGGSDLEELYFR
jgi:hypothetical protein